MTTGLLGILQWKNFVLYSCLPNMPFKAIFQFVYLMSTNLPVAKAAMANINKGKFN